MFLREVAIPIYYINLFFDSLFFRSDQATCLRSAVAYSARRRWQIGFPLVALTLAVQVSASIEFLFFFSSLSWTFPPRSGYYSFSHDSASLSVSGSQTVHNRCATSPSYIYISLGRTYRSVILCCCVPLAGFSTEKFFTRVLK